jgi:ribosomal protein S18 acetylase RimI-like enzyme
VNDTAIKVRSGKPEDKADLVDFQIRMALETENMQLVRSTVESGVDAVFENPLLGNYLVCESENEVIACLLITYEWSEWRNGLIYWIQSVYVVPEMRKQGIFAKLYQHVQNAAMSDQRVRGIRLYVENENLPAQKVYSKVGMKDGKYKVFEWFKGLEN